MKDSDKGIDTSFKTNLEGVYMQDLHQWKSNELTENQTVKRKINSPHKLIRW